MDGVGTAKHFTTNDAIEEEEEESFEVFFLQHFSMNHVPMPFEERYFWEERRECVCVCAGDDGVYSAFKVEKVKHKELLIKYKLIVNPIK